MDLIDKDIFVRDVVVLVATCFCIEHGDDAFCVGLIDLTDFEDFPADNNDLCDETLRGDLLVFLEVDFCGAGGDNDCLALVILVDLALVVEVDELLFVVIWLFFLLIFLSGLFFGDYHATKVGVSRCLARHWRRAHFGWQRESVSLALLVLPT